MAKVYSVPFIIYATAYVRADNADEAERKARTLSDRAIDIIAEGPALLSGARFDDPELPDLSFSPAMTIGDPEDGIPPELVHDDAATPTPTMVENIGPGDLVDLSDAPGASEDTKTLAEFEYGRVVKVEDEGPCIRVDFENFPSFGFASDDRLPVIKASAEDAAKYAEGGE